LAYLVRSLLYLAATTLIDKNQARKIMMARFGNEQLPFSEETAKQFLLAFLKRLENIQRLPMVFQFDPTYYYNENFIFMDPEQNREVSEFFTTMLYQKISIPREQIMVKVFKVKPGAMTAFGGLHKVEVWADKSLLKTKDVILSAGSFTDSVRMKVKDFLQMEQAKLANFATRGGYKLQVKPAKKSKSSGKVKSKSR